MKPLLTLLLSLLSLSAFGQSAIYSTTTTLDNGESFVAYLPDLGDPISVVNHRRFCEEMTEAVCNMTLFKALGVEEHRAAIEKFVSWNIEDSYFDPERIPNQYYGATKGGALRSFLNKVCQSEKGRRACFSLASDAICALCKLYPSDYRASLINTIDELIDFLGEHDFCFYYIADSDRYSYSQPMIYYAGNECESMGYTLKGFILRRVYIDDIPSEEIYDFLTSLRYRLRGLNLSSNPEVLYSNIINDELSFFYSSKGAFFSINGRLIPAVAKHMNNLDTAIEVQCTKDEESSYYLMTNGTFHGEFYPYEKDHDSYNAVLIDNSGDLLYSERYVYVGYVEEPILPLEDPDLDAALDQLEACVKKMLDCYERSMVGDSSILAEFVNYIRSAAETDTINYNNPEISEEQRLRHAELIKQLEDLFTLIGLPEI